MPAQRSRVDGLFPLFLFFQASSLSVSVSRCWPARAPCLAMVVSTRRRLSSRLEPTGRLQTSRLTPLVSLPPHSAPRQSTSWSHRLPPPSPPLLRLAHSSPTASTWMSTRRFPVRRRLEWTLYDRQASIGHPLPGPTPTNHASSLSTNGRVPCESKPNRFSIQFLERQTRTGVLKTTGLSTSSYF